MTKREFLTKVAAIEDVELAEFARGELDKMDASAEKRKSVPSKRAEENQPLVDKIVSEILTDEPKTATDIAAVIELSVQMTSARCRAAVAQGKAVQTDVKIPKRGTMKAYILA